MNLATLKAIERAQWRTMFIVDKALKAAPHDGELLSLREVASKEWGAWSNRLQRVELAAAEKRDKGEVLFIIFYPDGCCLRSVIRTPHRLVRRYETQPWYASKPFEDNAEVRRPEDWKWDFQYHYETERKRCERALDLNSKAMKGSATA